jgi:hypothetical protein
LIGIFDPIAQEDMSPKFFSKTIVNQIDSVVTTTAVIENVVITNVETITTELFPKVSSKIIAIEIEPGKNLNINPDLSIDETRRLMKLLIEHKEAFAWDYMNMKGISSEL